MPDSPRTAASVVKYRKAAFVAAGVGVAAAIVTCALLGMGRTEYQSQAILSYSPDTYSASGSPLSSLSAEAVAEKALDDAHLATIVDGLGLYPEMLQGASQAPALARLRSHISLSQSYFSPKSELDLHVAYTDQNQAKGPGIANALAGVLANYVLPAAGSSGDLAASTGEAATGSLVGAPPGPLPGAAPGPSIASAPQRTAQPFVPPAPNATPPAAPGSLAGLTKDQLRRKMNWLDGQLADLATEQSTVHAESLTVQGRISQLQSSGRSDAPPVEPAKPQSDPAAATRAQLSQLLATEQQKLTGLRERYTEAYPDVQTTEAHVAELQAKLANLPPEPRPSAPARRTPQLYQSNMDQLTAEESHLGERLRDLEHQIAGLEHRREEVRQAIQSAPDVAPTGQAQPLQAQAGQVSATASRTTPPATLASLPAKLPAVPPASAKRRNGAANQADRKTILPPVAVADTLPVRPFRIVQPATTSVPVQKLSPAVFIMVGAALAVYLLLCFGPLLLMRSAVVATEDDVRAVVSAQVVYLGSVGRIVP